MDDGNIFGGIIQMILQLFANWAKSIEGRGQCVGPTKFKDGTLLIGSTQIGTFLGKVEDLNKINEKKWWKWIFLTLYLSGKVRFIRSEMDLIFWR